MVCNIYIKYELKIIAPLYKYIFFTLSLVILHAVCEIEI